MNKIIDKFKKVLLTLLTGDLGPVKVVEDQIICYVDNKKIQKKYNEFDNLYKVNFYGANSIKVINTELLEKLGINKEIHYIVDGIRFKDKLFCKSNKGTKVTFQNCKFHNQICLTGGDKVRFINNKYYAKEDVNKFLNIRVDAILFMYDNFFNSTLKEQPSKFAADIIANELNIINSSMNVKENDDESIMIADNIGIINSNLSSTITTIICNNIEVIQSKIINNGRIIIDENSNNDKYSTIIESIESPMVLYNGMKHQRISNDETLKKYHRLELEKELRKIKNSLVTEFKDDKEILNETPIGLIKR